MTIEFIYNNKPFLTTINSWNTLFALFLHIKICSYLKHLGDNLPSFTTLFTCLLIFLSMRVQAEVPLCHELFISPSMTSTTDASDLVIYNSKTNLYEVLKINEHGLFAMLRMNSKELSEYLKIAPPHEKRLVRDLIERASRSFQEILKDFEKIAVQHGAKQSGRLKQESSLIKKIFDRFISYKSKALPYTLNQLNDLIGLRWALPQKNSLLKIDSAFNDGRYIQHSKEDWAQMLGVRPSQILEIVYKGQTQEELQKGKFYRAVHLVLQVRLEVKVELQLKTELMSLWDSWEHDLIYKSPFENEDQKKRVRTYTQNWAQLIRLIEDSPFPILELRNILDKSNISLKNRNNPLELLDEKWRQELQIDVAHSFFYPRQDILTEALGVQ